MAPRQRLELAPARAAKRRDHVQMVLAGAVERVRKGIGVGANSVDLLRKQIDGLDQAGVAAQSEQELMEAEIALEDRQQVACGNGRGVPALQFLQSLDLCRLDRKGNDADRHHLQLFTDRVDFPHLPGG